MPTTLLYLEHMHQYTCAAQAVEVRNDDGQTVVILDQTVFYPQGGGQPCDTGVITSADGAIFMVTDVRKNFEGVVAHMGTFEDATFVVGARVTCAVDVTRRELNTRCHSGGHLIDMGLQRLGLTWQAGKGYHFPAGPYVEYTGVLSDADIEMTRAALERVCDELIKEGITTRVEIVPGQECGRRVLYGEFGIYCGGTHVAALADLREIFVKKIKKDKGVIRVSYLL